MQTSNLVKFLHLKDFCSSLQAFLQECFLESDHTSLYHVAKGLMVLQALFGVIPNLYGKGQCSKVSCLVLPFGIRFKH